MGTFMPVESLAGKFLGMLDNTACHASFKPPYALKK